ncbi:hypothetical protein [Candidatus Annandia pinicola]|uniref:hypothetical protein n=1 Tax=Candidatus Annandia pinicola TaxID=1345117 RepID=UPI001D0151AE|nr:hypothetical protein [Candidatus Annandia pinicola]UDG80254.1 hypothetical protein GFK87_00014 [Candidatus Annandia pinicola]
MKTILVKNIIEKKNKDYNIIHVKSGYARNFLIPYNKVKKCDIFNNKKTKKTILTKKNYIKNNIKKKYFNLCTIKKEYIINTKSKIYVKKKSVLPNYNMIMKAFKKNNILKFNKKKIKISKKILFNNMLNNIVLFPNKYLKSILLLYSKKNKIIKNY